MELLLVSALGALGWALSKPNSLSTPAQPSPTTLEAQTNPHEFDKKASKVDSHTLQKEYDRRAKVRWEAARNPADTGVISPNMPSMPYYRSMKTQNTSEELNQRRMELYTGGESVWRHKEEAGPRFEPIKQEVSSGGGAGSTVGYEPSRYTVTDIQNNTLPFQQTRVGPGVNVGANVAASDGFHSMYRPALPDLGYKRNTLEGRTNPGASGVAAREVDPRFYSKGVPRIWTMHRRPLEKGMAAVTSQAIRPLTSIKGQAQCHVDGEEYFGGAGMIGQNASASAWDRYKSDDNRGLPLTNTTGARAGTGAYTQSTFDRSRMENQQRETPQIYSGPLAGDQFRHASSKTYDMAHTNRGIHVTGYGSAQPQTDLGIVAGHYVSSGTNHYLDVLQPTLREQIHDDTNGFAPASAVAGYGHTVQCTHKQLLKEAKRGGAQVLNTYIAHPSRTEAFRRAHALGDQLLERCHGSVSVRQDSNPNRVTSHGAAGAMYMNQAHPGVSTTNSMNKLQELNPNQDFSIAKTVLQSNPLHVSVS